MQHVNQKVEGKDTQGHAQRESKRDEEKKAGGVIKTTKGRESGE